MLIQKCTENNKLLHRPAMKNFFLSRAVSCPVLFFCFSFNLKVKPCNKSFIDQACSVKMAKYWPRSFFSVFMDRDENAKKRTWPISSHLDLTVGQ